MPTICSTPGWRTWPWPRLSAMKAFLQADSEFDRCLQRRGEALSLFVDEEPTSGHFPLRCSTIWASRGKD